MTYYKRNSEAWVAGIGILTALLVSTSCYIFSGHDCAHNDILRTALLFGGIVLGVVGTILVVKRILKADVQIHSDAWIARIGIFVAIIVSACYYNFSEHDCAHNDTLRTALLFGGAVLGVVGTILVVKRIHKTNVQIAESKQANFIAALRQGIDMLHTTDHGRQMAGVYYLQRLARSEGSDDQAENVLNDAFLPFIRFAKLKGKREEEVRRVKWLILYFIGRRKDSEDRKKKDVEIYRRVAREKNEQGEIDMKGAALNAFNKPDAPGDLSPEKWNNYTRLNSLVLPNANLRSADLSHSILSGTNLEEASLNEANLTGTCLQRANLQGADLRGANLENTKLEGADLRNVRLDKNLHDGNAHQFVQNVQCAIVNESFPLKESVFEILCKIPRVSSIIVVEKESKPYSFLWRHSHKSLEEPKGSKEPSDYRKSKKQLMEALGKEKSPPPEIITDVIDFLNDEYPD